MSLILEALKKLDREKAFIRRVTANIADEILKSDPIRPRKKFPLYFAAVLLTVCVTATLTYVVVSNLGLPTKTAPPAATAPSGASRHLESPSPSRAPVREAQEGISSLSSKDQNIAESKTPLETESTPASKAKVMKQPSQRVASVPPLREPKRRDQDRIPLFSSKGQGIAKSTGPSGTESSPIPKPGVVGQPGQRAEPSSPPREPAREGQEEISPFPAKGRDFAEKKPAPLVPVEKRADRNIGMEGPGTGSAIPKKAPEPDLSKTAAFPPSLRLTGIVWSEDASGRYAVINGAIVAEGAVILGAKVVEILPNKVRLIQNEQPFEIQLF